MSIRHMVRWVINGVSLILAVLALPEFGALIPPLSIPAIAAVTAVLNQILSVLRIFGMR